MDDDSGSSVLPLVSAAGLLAALTVGPPTTAVAELSHAAFHRAPDLTVHARRPLVPGFLDTGGPGQPGRATPPPCLGDVCQPRVSVPGYEPRYGRAHRSELFVMALERAHLEPFATIGWALVATGLRFDYTPVVFDGPNSGGHGWGSVFLRLRVRMDADNVPVFPRRPGHGDQRPARRSST
jgi:hypothetical protein